MRSPTESTHSGPGHATAVGTSRLRAGLSMKCMQTLYLGCFLVFSFGNLADWLHVYFVGVGQSVTFLVHDWVFCIMFTGCFLGSIVTFLVLQGCLEIAFRRRPASPTSNQGGVRLMCRKLCAWLGEWNCFRLSFLMLVLENLPMTLVNFWLISACSTPLPAHMVWPQFLSATTTLCSLLWRLFMVFYSYKHFVYFQSLNAEPPATSGEHPRRGSSLALDDVKGVLGIGALRSTQYDECWPVRMGVWIAFTNDEEQDLATGSAGQAPPRMMAQSMNSLNVGAPRNLCIVCLQGCCCVSLTVALYLVMFGTCCLPCCYFYTCRRNALYHRHKFARTCVRTTSACFHLTALSTSFVLVIALALLAAMYATSAYTLGGHHVPPGVRYACAYVYESDTAVYMSYEPEFTFRGSNVTGYCVKLDVGDAKLPRQWHFRRRMQNATLYLTVQNAHTSEPNFIVYNFAFLIGDSRCATRNVTSENLSHQSDHPWPHWVGCKRAIPVLDAGVPTFCNSTVN